MDCINSWYLQSTQWWMPMSFLIADIRISMILGLELWLFALLLLQPWGLYKEFLGSCRLFPEIIKWRTSNSRRLSWGCSRCRWGLPPRCNSSAHWRHQLAQRRVVVCSKTTTIWRETLCTSAWDFSVCNSSRRQKWLSATTTSDGGWRSLQHGTTVQKCCLSCNVAYLFDSIPSPLLVCCSAYVIYACQFLDYLCVSVSFVLQGCVHHAITCVLTDQQERPNLHSYVSMQFQVWLKGHYYDVAPLWMGLRATVTCTMNSSVRQVDNQHYTHHIFSRCQDTIIFPVYSIIPKLRVSRVLK